MATLFKDFNLSKPLLRALEDMGFSQATSIQEKSFPILMSGQDAVGIAQTGTGKTLAYLLPILRQLTYSEERPPRVLILVPTRELVAQVVEQIEKLSKYMSVRVYGIYGASNINTQKQRVFQGLDILVATPGRLIDLSLVRSVNLTNIKKLVIDEVDEMLSLGFRPQLMQVLERLPVKRQSMLFSATMSDDVEAIIKAGFIKPVFIETVNRGTPLEKIQQSFYEAKNFYTKLNLLRWLLVNEPEMTKALLFVKSKVIANYLEQELSTERNDFAVIHSNKSQPLRFESVKRFSEGSIRLLIATDVIARGLDLREVTHVINFDFPDEAETYLHRIGRTGRADRDGIAISFVSARDFKWLDKVEALMQRQIEEKPWPADVDMTLELLPEEAPVKKVKGKIIKSAAAGGGAFHEKKAKNSKVQLGGKRRQEKQRRAIEKSKSKRNR
jgi:ATP-dependent RNA helicase RhlE